MKQVPPIYFVIPIFTMLLWAGNNVVMRAAVGIIDPEAILVYRWGFAALLILPFVARSLWQYRRTIYSNLGKLASLGVLGMVLSQACAYYAAQTTTATNMGIIASLGPLMTFGFSALLLGEKPGWTTAAGALLSLFGLSLLIGEGRPLQILEVGLEGGNGIMTIGTVGYALYNVLLRRWLLPIPVWPSLFVQITMATLVLLPLYLLTPTAPITMKALPIILYSVLLISILSPILWISTVARLGANHSSLFINLLPPFTAVIAMLGLGEELYFYHLAGGVLTLLGVLLAQRGRARVSSARLD